jgi:hypothetical protein
MNLTLPALALVATLVCGCATTASEWETRFGDAVRAARAAQLVDPQASRRNVTPPMSDGKATAGAQTGYASSYGYAVKESKQPPLTVLPVVGGQ